MVWFRSNASISCLILSFHSFSNYVELILTFLEYFLPYSTILIKFRISSLPEKLPEVNWEYYQKVVPVPGLVEKFKKEYMGLQVALPTDSKNVGKSVDAQATMMVEYFFMVYFSLRVPWLRNMSRPVRVWKRTPLKWCVHVIPPLDFSASCLTYCCLIRKRLWRCCLLSTRWSPKSLLPTSRIPIWTHSAPAKPLRLRTRQCFRIPHPKSTGTSADFAIRPGCLRCLHTCRVATSFKYRFKKNPPLWHGASLIELPIAVYGTFPQYTVRCL